jgi:geranylgeranyl pyrophosphate synthase
MTFESFKTMTFESFQNDTRKRLEHHLLQLLNDSAAPRLADAMRYSLLDGGKRLRPLLVRATADSLGAAAGTWLHPAAALEMVHVYSLIHDDLPAMDDDDLRRGKATNHRAFDEATAILAGDALQSLAYEHLSQSPGLSADIRLAMVTLLARHSGQAGMAGGQMLDLQAEGRRIGLNDLARIHRLKTGALIESALQLGALCIDQPLSDNDRNALSTYGQGLGLAFQITDDILDVTADTATLGKTQGSDAARNKSTYVQLLGLDGARTEAEQHITEALSALDQLGIAGDSHLRTLASFVLHRDH